MNGQLEQLQQAVQRLERSVADVVNNHVPHLKGELKALKQELSMHRHLLLLILGTILASAIAVILTR